MCRRGARVGFQGLLEGLHRPRVVRRGAAAAAGQIIRILLLLQAARARGGTAAPTEAQQKRDHYAPARGQPCHGANLNELGARPPQAISEPAVEYAQVVDRFPAASSARETARPASASRTHVIQSGDTPYSIARNYGVKLASLVNANPGMDSRRLRPGQTLIIPLQ
ncbi:MAG: LysM peptidoglycan-binding domain-containing protein [Verrucomicrobia bacterium]|nr:MAG: LysM peptidoglycan-binding domain-containing protein [Verrucomicrobiota bacterium]